MSIDSGRSRLPLFRSPICSNTNSRCQSPTGLQKHEIRLNSLSTIEDDRHSIHDDPQLHRHTEATNLELFYDLFFAANLTVFTDVHEVRSGDTLKQYVGFFCILWFTWYQVGLYDVRFSMDSVFERIAKAIQFLVMIGFAVVGPKYTVGGSSEEDEVVEVTDQRTPSLGFYLKALTLYLMISRLVLVFQYLQSLWLSRQYKQTILPMSLIAGTYFAAAMIYLGLYWTFHADDKSHSYLTWYVVAILETIIATLVSTIWRRVVSFKGTHLVERMSLLTLIILGEGVVSLAAKCQRIVKSEGALRFTPGTIGNIICGVLILYFIYMIYFDWLEEDHFGTIMQQIWSFLHFPLHVALVLAVEGVAQCIIWRAAVVRGNDFAAQYQHWSDLIEQGDFKEVGRLVNETATNLLHRGLFTSSNLAETLELLPELPNIANASQVITRGGEDPNLASDALYWTYFTLFKTIFNIAGFDSPVERSDPIEIELNSTSTGTQIDFADESTAQDAMESTTRTAAVFSLTYAYFFTSIGLVVILCCTIAAISKRAKSRTQWARLIASSCIGLGLCLLAAASNTAPGIRFAFSPWVLPTVAICLFAVVVLNSVKPVLPGMSRSR